MRYNLVVLAIVATVASGSFDASGKQPEQRRGTGITTLHASPSVQSTVVTADGALRLLVLWRGTPGWAMTGARRDNGGGGGEGNVRIGLTRGAITLDLWVSPATNQVRLQGKAVEALPPGTNVLFIDTVDGPRGPVVARTMSVDAGSANVDPRKGSIVPLLRSSPAIVEYLRCDLNAPPPSSGPEDAKKLAVMLSRGFCEQLK